MGLPDSIREQLNRALGESGLRATKQREHVFEVLMKRRDHPTADEVYARAKTHMPTISLATVYNCLDTLVECNLVKKLNYEREPSRYCPNQGDHAHFMDEETGRVYDIDMPKNLSSSLASILPSGYVVNKVKLSFSGKAPPRQDDPPSESTSTTSETHHESTGN